MLKDVGLCEQHPHDPDRLISAKAMLRSRKRQRPKLENQSSVNPISLEENIAQTEFTMLLFFHPKQKHSIEIRSLLSDFCANNADKIVCLALFGGDPKSVSPDEKEDCKLFFHGSGFLEIGQENNDAGQKAITSLLHFLDVTQIPSVVVIPNSTGRPIMGQEITLEWNAGDEDNDDKIEALLQRWREGSSGLTLSQNIVSKVLGDSSSVCTIQ